MSVSNKYISGILSSFHPIRDENSAIRLLVVMVKEVKNNSSRCAVFHSVVTMWMFVSSLGYVSYQGADLMNGLFDILRINALVKRQTTAMYL